MINPVWLHTFKTLVEIGHFTQAAQALHMTQPGVSQHIRKLEEACSHKLIRREGKRFELTEQGRAVYQYALSLEVREKQLLDSLSLDDAYQGHCRLGCSGAMALQLYPALLELQAEHAGLIIELEAAPNQRILEQVRSGEIDMGLVTAIPSPALYEVETLGHETLSLILPAQVAIKSSITGTLQASGLIAHPDVLHYLALYCAQSGEPELEKLDLDRLPRAGYINQIHQILMPVAKGIGYTVLPQSTVDSFEQKNRLQTYKPRLQVQEPVYLVSKRNRELPRRFTVIRDSVRTNICR